METLQKTTFIQPFGVDFDLETGSMKNAQRVLTRKASDMMGYYKDEAALQNLIRYQNNPLHYEVFEVPVPEEYGHLMYCISKLQPGLVGNECYMTKGHYHTFIETGEIYLCLKGEGYMMMKTTDGQWKAERMIRGRMVYVPPFWAHRSINTGKEPLISFCVYQGDAGHNYGDIETEGFPARIFFKDNKIVIEDK
jgi:glucose-6-phosphate isomerase, archaeal